MKTNKNIESTSDPITNTMSIHHQDNIIQKQLSQLLQQQQSMKQCIESIDQNVESIFKVVFARALKEWDETEILDNHSSFHGTDHDHQHTNNNKNISYTNPTSSTMIRPVSNPFQPAATTLNINEIHESKLSDSTSTSESLNRSSSSGSIQSQQREKFLSKLMEQLEQVKNKQSQITQEQPNQIDMENEKIKKQLKRKHEQIQQIKNKKKKEQQRLELQNTL
jgi:hypothetical protein